MINLVLTQAKRKKLPPIGPRTNDLLGLLLAVIAVILARLILPNNPITTPIFGILGFIVGIFIARSSRR